MSSPEGLDGFERPDAERELPPRLRAALEALRSQGERPRPAFREGLRQAFVSGELETRPSVLGALEQWHVPAADPAFRANLRKRFIGAHAERESSRPRTVESSPRVRVGEARPSAPREQRPDSRGRRGVRIPLLGLALAAALLMAAGAYLVLAGSDPEPRGWRVVDGSPAALQGVIEGRLVAYPSLRELGRDLDRGGCILRTSDQGVRVLREGEFLLSLSADSELRILPREERGGGLFAIELLRGGLHIATGDGQRRWVRVTTPELSVEIRGRAVAVDVYPGQGTCVCNLEGEAYVRPVGSADDSPGTPVEPGRTWFQAPGAQPILQAIPAPHLEPLLELREVAQRHERWL